MIKRARSGYTIVETMFFIAISAFMLIYAVATMNARIAEVRYFDGAAQVEDFLQKQLSEVTRGVRLTSETGATPCPGMVGASNCTTLGRLISIEATDPVTFRVEEVYGDSEANTATLPELSALNAYHPVLKGSVQTYEAATGLTLRHNTFQNPTTGAAREAVFILRSPRTGAIEHIAYTSKPTDIAPALFTNGGNAFLNETVNVCLDDDSSDRLSFISIGPFPNFSEEVNDTGYFSLTRDATEVPSQGGC